MARFHIDGVLFELVLGEPQLGVLEGATPDELVIRTKAAATPIRVRRTDVVRLDVSRGTRRHTLKGLLAGAVAFCCSSPPSRARPST